MAAANHEAVILRWTSRPPLFAYSLALVVSVTAVALRISLDGLGTDIVPFALFYPAVLIAAVLGGIGPGIFSLALTGGAVAFFWLPPRYSLYFTDGSVLNLFLYASSAGSVIAVACMLRRSLRRTATVAASLLDSSTRLKELTAELEARVSTAVAEREEALQQLHETMKAETIGQLTGGIAHDFNNLLTPIIGSLDVIRSRPMPAERIQKMAEGALEAAEKARTLVSRLLAFGRRQLLQPRAVDAIALLNGLSDLIQRSIGPSTRLVMDLPPELPAIRVDPNQLELALLNLAVNARDAMLSGGTLTISAQTEFCEENPQLAPRVRISVVDTGHGMDAETLRRAVEPFFTTKTGERGTGLGLSMVDGLAAQSGGSLLLSSSVGIGTRAELWFPSTTEAVTVRAEENRPAYSQAPSLRILLVDDEPLVRTGLADMMREAGNEVVEVESAREALSLIEDCGSFDLVLTDHLMPGMTGVAMAQKLRVSHPQLPIIVISGYMGLDEDVPAEIVVLRKPIRQRELIAAINEARGASDKVIQLRSA
ncbi:MULTISPECIES: ATP-binding protein [unclassified Sphingomonas]|uniref:ATP-binding protein n=1 Tax=unclassified Sphingomonas TaxID=196159 RepID=UPI0006FE3389|nr:MULTISPECIES: ATP-binding protein [unclassified Sphingomonas]KQX17651.1 hypothetical protein ASD17_18145 [Sphingomonas sp. Root1294]KQY70577.1 hypothetical protein ASD39_22045 [Sphingomonas sp. Root50]KRB91933.1 hypothetical protein ASE22_08265 [Sphingomonas sp. Root720]